MTYTPKKSIEQEQEELDIKVSRRIDEILSSIKQVGSMYVEPDDILLVQVDEDMSELAISNLQKLLSAVFKDNKGIFTTDKVEFKVIKKGELYTEEDSVIESLKKEISDLKAEIENLKKQILN
jgi:polyhydroxyalkanoate synthesis regulator phasin